MGPLETSDAGNMYVFVAIKHFSKCLVAVTIPSMTADCAMRALLEHVIVRFGSCAEVVTDQGTKFQGEFEALLRHSLIDHRITSPNHPQAHGLAERAVQTIKSALRKVVEASGKPTVLACSCLG